MQTMTATQKVPQSDPEIKPGTFSPWADSDNHLADVSPKMENHFP